MLTEEELKALLEGMEEDRLERTTAIKATDKFSEAVCAFANDLPNHRRPGYLIVGVDDKGVPCGLKVTDQLLQNLGALRSDGNIQPLPAMSVKKFTLPAGDVAVVEVHPSDLPPVRYKGRVWIRVGPRRAVANEQDERILTERRVSAARSFDARPCRDAGLDSLALALFDGYRLEAVDAEVIAANRRTREEQLASLRFYDLQSACPTFAGILLFGKNPRYYLPGAYVQFLRFPGTTMTDIPDDQAEISGDLLTVLRELELRVRTGVHGTLQPLDALRERLRPDYPEVAVRELLMNAVLHRSYESSTPIRFSWLADRIEVQSPGGLYGEVTPENYLTQNSYRNPTIAEAMKTLGYVNRFGYGIQRAQSLLTENGNGPAEFQFAPQAVTVTIRGGRR